MKKSFKKMLLFMAVVMTVMMCFAFSASAAKEGYYTYTVSDGKAKITDVSTSLKGDVTIPSTLGGYPVTVIGVDAFYKHSGVKSIVIPNGVTTIEYGAFEGCDMESITIPESLIYVEDDAFYGISETLEYVFYGGTESQKKNIDMDDHNWRMLSFAVWHYKATGHTYGEYKTVKEATCTSNGSKRRVCSGGGCVETKKIEKLGHKYSDKYTVDKKATCTAAGSKSKHCTRSGCSGKTSVTSIPATGHSYGVYVTTKKATPSADGTMVKTCTKCSKEYKLTIYKVSAIKLEYTSTSYSGKAKTPKVTVKNSKGNALKKGTDYEISYSSNKAIGTGKVKLTFYGNYSGTKTLEFKIVLGATDKLKAKQTATTVALSWNKVVGAKGYKVYVYNKKGELQLAKTTTKTSMTVDDLSKGTYYKFTVKAYTTANKKTVWAEKAKSISVTTLPGTPTLKVTAGKGKAELSWSKVKGANGYVLYMASSKKGEYSKIGTFEGVANLKATKSKLKSGKTYYFKVRAYKTVNGKNLYSSWSSVKSVKIK